jgi:hypothetical protein
MEIDEFVGMCGRSYRGCILECFRQGKVYPGVVGLVGKVSINNLLTDWEG